MPRREAGRALSAHNIPPRLKTEAVTALVVGISPIDEVTQAARLRVGHSSMARQRDVGYSEVPYPDAPVAPDEVLDPSAPAVGEAPSHTGMLGGTVVSVGRPCGGLGGHPHGEVHDNVVLDLESQIRRLWSPGSVCLVRTLCAAVEDVGDGAGGPASHGLVRRGCKQKLSSDEVWADDSDVGGHHYFGEGVVDVVLATMPLLLQGKP